MTHIEQVRLASIGLGHQILTPEGLSQPVAHVRWCDIDGHTVVIEWDTGRSVEAAGVQMVHAVKPDHARTVTRSHLAVSPRPIWTSEFPEELLRIAWNAHIAGDRSTVLNTLEPLRRQDLAQRPDAWQAAATGLALYAFTAAAVGDHGRAFTVATQFADDLLERDPRGQRPSMIRYRLAHALPTESLTTRLHETLQRWALATAYRLPTTRHETQHFRDLNRIRSAPPPIPTRRRRPPPALTEP
jgi:hypothetical protein